jgi:hypothetical protein
MGNKISLVKNWDGRLLNEVSSRKNGLKSSRNIRTS